MTPLIRWTLLAAGLAMALYALPLLPFRVTDLGLWLILLLAVIPLFCGFFPRAAHRLLATAVGRVLRWVIPGGYGLLVIAFAVTSVCIARAAAAVPQPGADAVIVLGAGLWGNDPSPALGRRLDAALEYARANPQVLVVVSGGQGPDEPRTEAEAMAEYLLERGLAPARLIREDRACSTYENFTLSKALLDARLPEGYRVVFATSDFHILRSARMAREQDLNAQGLAASSDPYFLPMFYARECMAVIKTWLFGSASLQALSRIF